MSREFKDRLKGFRLALAERRGKDVRPADVARHMGISRAAYLHWEKGIRQPKDIGTYMRLAAFFEVQLADLGVPVASMAPEPQRPGNLETIKERLVVPVRVVAPKKKAPHKKKRVQGSRPQQRPATPKERPRLLP